MNKDFILIRMILEKNYFEQFKIRHSDLSNENDAMIKAFPNDWNYSDDLQEKIYVLQYAIEKNIDIEDALGRILSGIKK